jgi:hypothetical protein
MSTRLSGKAYRRRRTCLAGGKAGNCAPGSECLLANLGVAIGGTGRKWKYDEGQETLEACVAECIHGAIPVRWMEA